MILLNVMRRIWSEVTRIWHKWGLWTRLSGCWGRCPGNSELQVLWNWQLSKEAIVTDSILFSQARSPWFSKPGQWHSFWEPGLFKCWSFWPATVISYICCIQGMWDLKLAMHFVQENIGHLGGDPEKATTITGIITTNTNFLSAGDPLWSVGGCHGRSEHDVVPSHQRQRTF